MYKWLIISIFCSFNCCLDYKIIRSDQKIKTTDILDYPKTYINYRINLKCAKQHFIELCQNKINSTITSVDNFDDLRLELEESNQICKLYPFDSDLIKNYLLSYISDVFIPNKGDPNYYYYQQVIRDGDLSELDVTALLTFIDNHRVLFYSPFNRDGAFMKIDLLNRSSKERLDGYYLVVNDTIYTIFFKNEKKPLIQILFKINYAQNKLQLINYKFLEICNSKSDIVNINKGCNYNTKNTYQNVYKGTKSKLNYSVKVSNRKIVKSLNSDLNQLANHYIFWFKDQSSIYGSSMYEDDVRLQIIRKENLEEYLLTKTPLIFCENWGIKNDFPINKVKYYKNESSGIDRKLYQNEIIKTQYIKLLEDIW